MPGRIILGIPGRWKTIEDLVASILKANANPKKPRYVALPLMILDQITKETFTFEVQSHDPALSEAFRVAGQGQFSKSLLASIDKHTFTAYVISRKQNVENARSMLALAACLLDAGGLAVKVETTCVAHTPKRWRYLANDAGLLALHDAYVTLVGGEDFNYTCGMHNLGLPDSSLTTEVPIEDAPGFLVAFNQWNLLERPRIKKGERFAVALSEPAFTVTRQKYGYDAEDEYNNPHGRWHMELAGAKTKGRGLWQEQPEPLFMTFKDDDSQMRKCVRQARATLGQFFARFDSPQEFGDFLIKTRIEEGDDHAFLWLKLLKRQKDTLHAEVFEAPPEFPKFKAGKRIKVLIEDVLDWAQIRCGALVGGFSMRLQRSKVAKKDRKLYDLYSGIISYASVEKALPE